MTHAQKQAAIDTAMDAIRKLLEIAPDYGECGISLTIHAGDVKRISETCTRTLQPGADHA
ncbi:hypothetical protein FACS189483_06590 [Spirochaetia bacterium]|nr:hypothetical protein FACS189483_06590 [Spirochaetia bacterium]